MGIEVVQLCKNYGQQKVFNELSLTIESGEMLALLGPSGSGKTTLLRIIAGLDRQDAGSIAFNGQDVSYLPARDRKVGFVFQHYALFRHMTVFDNIAFGLSVLPRKQRPTAKTITATVTKLLELIQLSHMATRYPAQLSGGQRQRVALARALATEPKVLLLDEPFGALDALVRDELRLWLRQLHQELRFTSIFVTHDQHEAMEIADRVVIMRQGKVEQIGTPEQINATPANRFVLEFLGEINHSYGSIEHSQLLIAGYPLPFYLNNTVCSAVDIYFRPWDIQLSVYRTAEGQLPVRVHRIRDKGHYLDITLQAVGWSQQTIQMVTQQHSERLPLIGQECFVQIQRLYVNCGDRFIEPLAVSQSRVS